MTKMAKPIPQGAGWMAIIIAAVAVFLVITLSKNAMKNDDKQITPTSISSNR